MHKIWLLVNSLNWNKRNKSKIFILLNMLLYACLGGLVWLLVGQLYLKGPT